MTISSLQLIDASVWEGKGYSGGWSPLTGGTERVLEPATGETLTVVGVAGPEDVADAAKRARTAQKAWVEMPYLERQDIFLRAARTMIEHKDEIANWVVRETGSTRTKASAEVQFAAAELNEAAAMLTHPLGTILPSAPGTASFAKRVPHGVVGIISPFNFPLVLSLHGVAPALATGNAVVLKPDIQTPVSGGFVIARVFEIAGLPKDLLHVLPGDAPAGEALVQCPDVAMISFTGSSRVGRIVGEKAGRLLKKCTLELGGKNAFIVLDDADVDRAVNCAAFGAFFHQGQICMSAGLHIVHARVAKAYADGLVEKARALKVGDPAKGDVSIGPLINRRQVERVQSIVDASVAAGAQLRIGGRHEGPFYFPTVLDGVTASMPAFGEEIFGPVAPVAIVDSAEEAVALANRSEYGLVASIMTGSTSRGMDVASRLHVGMVHINDQTVKNEVTVPFGGRGASGNGSRQGGAANWEEFTQWQWITARETAPTYSF